MNKMTKTLKTAIVLGGYLAAFAVACLILWVYRTWLVPPGADNSGGMAAFGDMILFLGAWVFLSIFPTALALYFLRSNEPFWLFFSIGALALSLTGVLWEGLDLVAGISRSPSAGWWGPLGMMRLAGSPLLSGGFGLFTLLAPAKRPRLFLALATVIEAFAAFSTYALLLFGHRFP